MKKTAAIISLLVFFACKSTEQKFLTIAKLQRPSPNYSIEDYEKLLNFLVEQNKIDLLYIVNDIMLYKDNLLETIKVYENSIDKIEKL